MIIIFDQDGEHSFGTARFASLSCRLRFGHQAGDRLLIACNDQFFTLRQMVDQLRQLFLGFFNGYGGHESFSPFFLAEGWRRGRDRGEPFVLSILPLPAALSRPSKALDGSLFGSWDELPREGLLQDALAEGRARNRLWAISVSADAMTERRYSTSTTICCGSRSGTNATGSMQPSLHSKGDEKASQSRASVELWQGSVILCQVRFRDRSREIDLTCLIETLCLVYELRTAKAA
jgi:hypothetical protein